MILNILQNGNDNGVWCNMLNIQVILEQHNLDSLVIRMEKNVEKHILALYTRRRLTELVKYSLYLSRVRGFRGSEYWNGWGWFGKFISLWKLCRWGGLTSIVFLVEITGTWSCCEGGNGIKTILIIREWNILRSRREEQEAREIFSTSPNPICWDMNVPKYFDVFLGQELISHHILLQYLQTTYADSISWLKHNWIDVRFPAIVE